MSISFNDVPANSRVPFIYVEFDSSNAKQGLTLQPYRNLIVGQKTSGGSQAADTLVKFTSEAQAKTLFGDGSMLHLMAKALLENDKLTEAWALVLADDGAGVAASGTLTVTGPATAAGSLSLYIAG